MQEEVLAEKGREFAVFLFGVIAESGREFYRKLIAAAGQNEQLLFDLLTEELFLHLSVADRLAFEVLGDGDRRKFMDAVILDAREIISRKFKTGADATDFRNWFVEQFNLRQKEYATFKDFVPEGDQPPKGTLFWEFAKKQSKMFSGPVNPVDVIEIQLHEIHIMGAVGLRELLDKQN